MTPRLWACVWGIHAWAPTIGPSTYAMACRHCSIPRTR